MSSSSMQQRLRSSSAARRSSASFRTLRHRAARVLSQKIDQKSAPMFGRRDVFEDKLVDRPKRDAAPSKPPAPAQKKLQVVNGRSSHAAAPIEQPYEIKSNEYYEIKQQVFNALIE